ncbi:N-acetylmuramoyl-L-alanine amidase [Vibrio hannami]|uniref:N-acetylmuramoyl-L-alanine amidase n=1 Tax=Vibrio hannami TaxID=2717094 RepID=UPI00240EE729|nr:N-acetylmuramoyl-L-alanine amidase [Vibrio hannami]MDG3089142.1 N-acetylmuramoyl-L-alanine amidase [Vibrio hannami]
MRKIALIVGHGAAKQGASNDNGVTEYLFNDELAHMIAPILIQRGFEPLIVYRTGSYRELPKQVNDTGADVAVSLHCNAFNKKASGSEVLHYMNSSKSEKLARCININVLDALELPDRGLRPVNVKQKGKAGDRGGYLCFKTAMPCVIVEPFFIDNDSDLARATECKFALAQAIARGVIEYAG